MSVSRLGISVFLFASAACNPFGSQNVVEVNPGDSTLHARWNASLSSPATLAGAVQMNGTARMTPSPDGATTIVTVDLGNATPGGVHPWEVRRGECGASTQAAAFGSRDAYEPLEVGSDGRASSRVTIDAPTPAMGRYFVVVLASESNYDAVVACGNFAPPNR